MSNDNTSTRDPHTDIRRTCNRCGTLTFCRVIRSTHKDKKYKIHVEKTEAVCPACMEGEKA